MTYLYSISHSSNISPRIVAVDAMSTANWKWTFANGDPVKLDKAGRDFIRRFKDDPASFHSPRAPLDAAYTVQHPIKQAPGACSRQMDASERRFRAISQIHEISTRPRGLAMIVINNDPHYPIGCTEDVPHVDGDKLINLFTQMQYVIYGDRKHFTHTRQDLIQLVKAFAVDQRQQEYVEDVIVCVVGRGVFRHGVLVCADGKTVCRPEVDYLLCDNLCPWFKLRSRFTLFVIGVPLDTCGVDQIVVRIPDERICDSDQERLEHARMRHMYSGCWRTLQAFVPVSDRVSSQAYGSMFVDNLVRAFAEHWHEQFTSTSTLPLFFVLTDHMKQCHTARSRAWKTGAVVDKLLDCGTWQHQWKSWHSPLSIFEHPSKHLVKRAIGVYR